MIFAQLFILIYSVIIHEITHGYVANILGDPTARSSGRLTLNPIPHIDPLFTIGLPLVLFLLGSPVILGGAKPIPLDPFNFKNPKRDIAITAISGPLSNFILALIFVLILQFIRLTLFNTDLYILIQNLLLFSVIINIFLGIFNLLPIPPLDGFKVIGGILPGNLSKGWFRLERFGFLFLFIFVFFLSSILRDFVYPFANFLINILT